MARESRSSFKPPAALSSSSRTSARPAAGSSRSIKTSQPPALRSTRPAGQHIIQNSSDDDSDTNLIDLLESSSSDSGRRLLDAVVVSNAMPAKPMLELPDTDDSASAFSEGRGSSIDFARDYETPATSKSMTPNGYISNKGKGKAAVQGEPEAISKRKRSSRLSKMEKAQDETDEALALLMQEEEFGAEPSSGTKGGKSRLRVVDSDDSDSDLDFLPAAPSSKRARLRTSSSRPLAGAATRKPLPPGDESDAASALTSPPPETEDESVFAVDSEMTGVESEQASDEELAEATSALSGTTLNNLAAAQNNAARMRRAAALAGNARRGSMLAERWRRRRWGRREARRQKLEDAHPEIKTMWDDLASIPVITPVAAEQPASITRKLKPFQLEGLDWMVKQEKSQYKGGLLGDEMGMGKTIQAVSLIMSDFPAKNPTLVVVPPVALMQWQNEIRDYTDGKLNVLVYHSTNARAKNLTVKDIKKYNVLLISYNSLESLHRKEIKGWTRNDEIVKEDSPIHAVKFHRLILDEAHSIKQRTTGVAKACFALSGTYKWCLSGTPVQNRIGEFFSLLRFLEVRPFADYFCERCPCARLHWSLNEEYKCDHCNHSGAEHRSIFNEELLNPITGDDLAKREGALDNLHLITARVMLRRMKRDHTSSMELPPKEVTIHNEFFGEIERDFSSSIMTNTGRQFDTYVSRGVMLNNYANIFGLIMQMRQVANHPDLLLKKHAEGGQNVLICNICDEPAEEAIRSRCRHDFCRSCVRNYVQSCEGAGTDADCPRCHIPLSVDWEQPELEQDEELVRKSSIINRIRMEDWTSSTKIEMLVYDLYKLRSRKRTLKSIVFSQFTSMLQLIEWRLRRAGFNTVMLDGSMTPAQRQRSIDYFMKNTDVEVFLVSLKAGGVALNLTEASRVFIVDPWWNPAAEWQSADRCHRIGQKRPCVITRLCIEDSVESRMVLLQEKKASMISASINNDKVAMEKLSPEDLQFLFRGT